MAATPTWIAAMLAAQGWANQDGVGRRLRVGICRQCKARVLRGLDADRLGIAREVNPDALDTFAEALAIFAGARTYSVWKTAGGYELHYRSPQHITATPADQSTRPIVGDHQCEGVPG